MKTVGIVAEYNPLHYGHLFHMDQAKRISGADACIVAMSGSFVQRGEPACANKYVRAEWACRSGADLVMEIPTVFSLSSAERFALGSVRTLLGTGILTHLAFGCENGDIDLLQKACQLLTDESDVFKERLHVHMKEGQSYPRARFNALKDIQTDADILDAVIKPNNILALEYLRILNTYAPDVIPVAIPRTSDNHNSLSLLEGYPSSTAIREGLISKNRSVVNNVPYYVAATLMNDDGDPVQLNDFTDMIFYSILSKSREELRRISDVSEGFENVLFRAARSAGTADDLLDQIKSKRYTLSRCKRILLNILLGIEKSFVIDTIRNEDSDYCHVLAVSSGSRSLLSKIKKYGQTSLIVRKEDYDNLSEVVRKNVEIDSFANELHAIAGNYGPDLHRDFQGPVFVG